MKNPESVLRIGYSRTKIQKLLLMAIGLLLLCIFVPYSYFADLNPNPRTVGKLRILVGLLWVFGLPSSIGILYTIVLISRSIHPALVVDEHGLRFDPSMPASPGIIPWTDVSEIAYAELRSKSSVTPILGLHLCNPASIAARVGTIARLRMKLNTATGFPPVSITDNVMDASITQLFDHITRVCPESLRPKGAAKR